MLHQPNDHKSHHGDYQGGIHKATYIQGLGGFLEMSSCRREVSTVQRFSSGPTIVPGEKIGTLPTPCKRFKFRHIRLQLLTNKFVFETATTLIQSFIIHVFHAAYLITLCGRKSIALGFYTQIFPP